MTGNVKCAELLVEAGANINKADGDGWSPLHLACKEAHLDVIQFLVNAGANVQQVTDDGVTALHYMVAVPALSHIHSANAPTEAHPQLPLTHSTPIQIHTTLIHTPKHPHPHTCTHAHTHSLSLPLAVCVCVCVGVCVGVGGWSVGVSVVVKHNGCWCALKVNY